MASKQHLPRCDVKHRDRKAGFLSNSFRRPSARIVSILLAALAIAPVAGSPATARSLEEIKQAGQLRVTVYRDYKPWSWMENGKMKGIDVDVGAALARQLGVKVDYLELLAENELNDDLRNGVWRGSLTGTKPGDVMLHVPYDKQIEADNDKIKLVAPYHSEGLAMAVEPAKAASARDFTLFETEKIAVDRGTLSDAILLSVRDYKLIDHVVHVKGVANAAAAYERGEVSAFYGEAALVENLAHTVSRPTTIVFPKHSLARDWAIGGAVKVDAVELGDAIDKGLAKLKSSGEMQRIFAAYGVTWRDSPQD